jgi:hypothetical protein
VGEHQVSSTTSARKAATQNLPLSNQTRFNAAESGVTKKYLILKALQDAGYRIDAEDLEEDGRRVR